MELYDVMRTTFAAREFTGEPLSDKVLDRILENARFAPSGGNRQAGHVIVVRDQQTREGLIAAAQPGARRYFAQIMAGESPWNPVTPTQVDQETIDATTVPASVAETLRTASVVLVVCVDLRLVAATDQELNRVGVISGASVYPLAWNILLAARAEGFGGTLTTMAVAQEPKVRELLGIPETYAVAAVLPIGKPIKQLTRLRRNAIEEFVTLERFDGDPYRPEHS
ncbi:MULTISPECIES: nitroreductase family protein [Mycobacteroides]|jgi:nitroreductase|uniref:Nitroreductase n=1 Tax=Mycobacteroides chelonae TaxID=1774 RepID=A0AB73N1U0_MYCCH|nr:MULTISPECIES: nitroreductase family protein [Mycobacteroides]KRQ29160.1 nitroreductase [Mycobacteroides sp. H072]KRQ38377.1 nitroreductase [Mycobacteroides sp. H002]KRQ52086.1 nitroreductase [Mycobacteroides sp. H054]KRQ71358.1 nitroreductase [Mycobacteroides sp. H001]MBF9318168.1 nitroreductase family protein [Mycobacteroides chelonae]